MEKQLTAAPHGHILTNTGVRSPDGQWIVYDVRSDHEGALFDGDRIERVNVETGEVQVLYQSQNGAKCGVATYHPKQDKVVFILGPEHPTADWNYAPNRRQGVIVDAHCPGHAIPLDARDLAPPFTPGALRGGTHVHVFDAAGQWVSFTYNDNLAHPDQRNVGVCVPDRPVRVPPSHARNHDGTHFSVLVTRTTATPRPGSNEIARAFDDAWVGTNGYQRPDGARQRRAIAFFGVVVASDGRPVTDLFIADLPEDVTIPGDGPLAGTPTDLPAPPRGTVQRRLTNTTAALLPAIGGRTRQWPRSSPDGSKIAFLMHDTNEGIQQLWTISPNGGAPRQLTHNRHDISSAFSWSPDGARIAHTMDNNVCVTDVATAVTTRLTPRSSNPPRPEACVFSPDGSKIAYVRTIEGFNQVFVSTTDY
jgi:hypothetical protein